MRVHRCAWLLTGALSLTVAFSSAAQAGTPRFAPHEILIRFVESLSPAQILALGRRHRLTPIEQRTFTLSDTPLGRWRIRDHRSVAAVVRALKHDTAVASAQPNYLYSANPDR